MRNERRLDVEGRHPHAAYLEHVVGAPTVIIIAVGVASVRVAGMGPLAGKGAAALLALVPIAFAGRWSPHEELADLAGPEVASAFVDDARLVAGHRFARRAIADVAGTVTEKR